MHIGGVLIFEGPPPAFEDFLDHVRGRLHLVPRYRQKLATPPLETGRPLWVDDPTFNLEYHIRHTALPAPGTEEQLLRLAARIASQQLDRAKPLWEMLARGGARGRPLRADLQDPPLARRRRLRRRSGDRAVRPRAEPGAAARPTSSRGSPHPSRRPAELVVAGVRGMRQARPLGLADAGASRRAPGPAASLNRARDAAEGVGRDRLGRRSTPRRETPLNVEIGPHRRYAVVRQQLADYKEVKDALGGTVNDVVLTVVSGALAGWLRARGVRTEGLEMRALVPVSVRTQDERGTLGNQLAVMRGPLPVYIPDPVARLRFVKTAMDGLKESKAGGRRGDARRGQQPGAADDPGPGLAAELLDPAVQPDRHQHPRAAVAAVRARPPARGPVPDRVPAPRATRSRSRSCPTTAASTTACWATTTRCRTST